MMRGICLAAVWALSGCTAMLWENKNEAVRVAAGGDRIYAFGVGNEASRGQLSPGTLAMMGERFWYVLYPSISKDLAPVLKADLPERFRMVDMKDGAELAALPVDVNERDHEFNSEFCLKYRADGAVRGKLEALGFNQVKSGDHVRCFVARGHLYTSPMQIATDYRFESVVPVVLHKLEIRPRGGAGRMIGKVLLTPVALAADAVGMVTVYPAALIGLQAGGGLKIVQ